MNKPIFIDDETAKIACKLNLNKKTIIIDKIFIQSTMNLLFIMNNKPKMAYSHDLAIMYCQGCLSWMTFMDDFHAWTTNLSYFYILLAD